MKIQKINQQPIKGRNSPRQRTLRFELQVLGPSAGAECVGRPWHQRGSREDQDVRQPGRAVGRRGRAIVQNYHSGRGRLDDDRRAERAQEGDGEVLGRHQILSYL